MNLKHLMMNGKVLVAVFTVFVVLVIIFAVIIPNMREDSVLGHSNPAKQKLMVIDQDTGAISFVNKSLQGINEDFTGYEGKVLSALKMLLGDNLDLNPYASRGNGIIAHIEHDAKSHTANLKQIMGNDFQISATGLTAAHKNRTKHDGNNGILGRLRLRVENVVTAQNTEIAKKISNGARINMLSGGPNRNEFALGDENCNGRQEADRARWCRGAPPMDIRVWCVGNCNQA